ncbi:dihydrolipoyl dehydrogenase [Methylogaea oryzae]|uniref:Dihydrolipoyl dehydrogenase n=1 Tax=Methylogaea oryzae TaxID=1295382 RepID=A0A8D5AG61_9GAMM|nr:dihydrolipoyl dehydrogenase [Methylogaea oryzae]BBL70048.1 dihydrolipoyl dehydrogenase [Methylogaea oryzae]
MTESASINTEVLVLGGGPGGYTAAFRAADLGKKVVIVERYGVLGGVCSNVGCIPSKALLHLAHTIHNAKEAAAHGVSFGEPQIDVDKVRAWKDKVVAGLATGLKGLAKQRQVQHVQGVGRFVAPNQMEVQTAEGVQRIVFENAIIASGSKPVKLPGMPWGDPRLMDSTDALALADIPKRLLIVGGGVIGMEMASVYHALGSKVSVVELASQLIPGCDPDLVRPLTLKVKKEYENVLLSTKVAKIEAKPEGLEVTFEGEGAPAPSLFDRVLVAVGRKPNSADLGLEALGLKADERGFIAVDNQQRTAVSHIFAIGDVVGNPMLAHKATHQGKVAAEVIAGHKVAFQALAIPSVAYTDPEVAWMGLTETEAQAQGVEYEKAVFPWAASGRAAGMNRKEGLTKILCDKNTQRVLGAGITGVNAGDLISEAMLALEMGADVEDIGLTIHPHPTLSETFAFAAEMVHGSITDLYVKK